MNIRLLTPALADDYLRLLEDAFGDNPHWVGCYCRFALTLPGQPRRDQKARNRENRRATIEAGGASGLLAYHEQDLDQAGYTEHRRTDHFTVVRKRLRGAA